jgi:hypothetical protein
VKLPPWIVTFLLLSNIDIVADTWDGDGEILVENSNT